MEQTSRDTHLRIGLLYNRLLVVNLVVQVLALASLSESVLVRSLFRGSDLAGCVCAFISLTALFALLRSILFRVFLKLPSRPVVTSIAILLETFATLYLIVDSRVFSRFGVHLDSRAVGFNFHLNDFYLSSNESILAITLLIVCPAFEYGTWKALSVWPRFSPSLKPSSRFLSPMLLIFALVISGTLIALIPDQVPFDALPFSSRWIFGLSEIGVRSKFASPKTTPALDRKPSILFVLSDSFRWDLISPELTPNLFRLKSRAGCVSSERHFPGGHTTPYGSFSFLYGLESFQMPTLRRDGVLSPALEILRRNGYTLSAFDNSDLQRYKPAPIESSEFNSYSPLTLRSGRSMAELDSEVMDKVLSRLTEVARVEPQFVFAFLYSTHSPYSHRVADAIHVPFEDKAGVSSAELRTRSRNRYFNSAHFIDSLVGRLLEKLEPRIDSGDLILAFSGDHGEELWEHGKEGHMGENFEDERTRTPLILCLPPKTTQTRTVKLSTGADIFPTVLSSLIDDDSVRSALPFSGHDLLRHPRTVAVVAGDGFPTFMPLFSFSGDGYEARSRLNPTPKLHIDVENLVDTKGVPIATASGPSAQIEKDTQTVLEELTRFLQFL